MALYCKSLIISSLYNCFIIPMINIFCIMFTVLSSSTRIFMLYEYAEEVTLCTETAYFHWRFSSTNKSFSLLSCPTALHLEIRMKLIFQTKTGWFLSAQGLYYYRNLKSLPMRDTVPARHVIDARLLRRLNIMLLMKWLSRGI